MNDRQIEQWCQLHSQKSVTELRLRWDFPRDADRQKVRECAHQYGIKIVQLFKDRSESVNPT